MNPAERDVASLHVGIDLANQGARVNFRLVNGRDEAIFYPRIIARQPQMHGQHVHPAHMQHQAPPRAAQRVVGLLGQPAIRGHQ